MSSRSASRSATFGSSCNAGFLQHQVDLVTIEGDEAHIRVMAEENGRWRHAVQHHLVDVPPPALLQLSTDVVELRGGGCGALLLCQRIVGLVLLVRDALSFSM